MLSPAKCPVDQAICKLKPPVMASRSSTSPAKYRCFTSLDSMVAINNWLTKRGYELKAEREGWYKRIEAAKKK